MAKRSMFPRSYRQFSDELWVREISPRRFHCVRVEHTEEWGDNASEQYGKYCVALREVDLNAFDWALVCSVLSSCGLRVCTFEGGPAIVSDSGDYVATSDKLVDAAIVDAAMGHGAAAPLWEESGNNLGKLVRAALSESAAMLRDADYAEDRLDGRAVNAIGTSARDYMLGKLGRRANERDKLSTIYRCQYGWDASKRLLGEV